MIKAIVCADEGWGIGKKDGLLYNIPADMHHFVSETQGKVVVFGYTTYQSLRVKPLKRRVNVVLWDQATSLDCIPGCITFKELDQLIHFVSILAKNQDVYICGGSSIYKIFIDKGLVDLVDLTVVMGKDEEATAFFPDLNKYNFHKVRGESFWSSNSNENNTGNHFISRQVWVKDEVGDFPNFGAEFNKQLQEKVHE